jgi:hypothetical protein
MNTIMDSSDFQVLIQNKRNVNVLVDMGNNNGVKCLHQDHKEAH